MKTVLVINGPNLNMLGIREPNIYGDVTLAEIEKRMQKIAEKTDTQLVFFQSNHEGAIIDFILSYYNKVDFIIINPAAYTKNGYGILEAIACLKIPFIEIHISNIFSRGGWHSESIFSDSAAGFIAGFGPQTYELALSGVLKQLESL